MDSEVNLYLKRAEDEFLLAKKDLQISTDFKLKEIFGIAKEKTFFHSVITHAYYAIFYCAKAYLISKGIKTKPPEEHKKTYEEFKKLVDLGKLDKELLAIYDKEIVKAETLLDIFFIEKRKRGIFTYDIRSEINLPYAKESIQNAQKFISALKSILENI